MKSDIIEFTQTLLLTPKVKKIILKKSSIQIKHIKTKRRHYITFRKQGSVITII